MGFHRQTSPAAQPVSQNPLCEVRSGWRRGGRCGWTSVATPGGVTPTRKLRPCGSRAANRRVQRSGHGRRSHRVLLAPGKRRPWNLDCLLAFSTAPTLGQTFCTFFLRAGARFVKLWRACRPRRWTHEHCKQSEEDRLPN